MKWQVSGVQFHFSFKFARGRICHLKKNSKYISELKKKLRKTEIMRKKKSQLEEKTNKEWKDKNEKIKLK